MGGGRYFYKNHYLLFTRSLLPLEKNVLTPPVSLALCTVISPCSIWQTLTEANLIPLSVLTARGPDSPVSTVHRTLFPWFALGLAN